MTERIRDGFNSTLYEPVAQTFFGFRAFRVVTDGTPLAGPAASGVVHEYAPGGATSGRGALRGIFKAQFQWGAEANHAVCLRLPTRGTASPAVDRVQGKPHSLMLPECDCGFWAYTNGSHALAVSGAAVLGIIEGWGRCVLGEHGFRAEKARIVALALPTPDEVDAAMIDSAYANLTDAVSKAMHAFASAFVAMAHAARSRAGQQAGPPPTVATPTRATRPWESVDAALAADIRRAYPHAAMFESLAAMHRAFPLSDLTGLLPPKVGADAEQESAS